MYNIKRATINSGRNSPRIPGDEHANPTINLYVNETKKIIGNVCKIKKSRLIGFGTNLESILGISPKKKIMEMSKLEAKRRMIDSIKVDATKRSLSVMLANPAKNKAEIP